jgi:hypothetical protein
MVKAEGDRIQDEISKQWPEHTGSGQTPLDLEFDLIIIVITYAILNPCEPVLALSLSLLNKLTDTTSWDVTRFADRVKNTVGRKDGVESETDSRLPVYFEEADFGDIMSPATILDQYGRVMTWVLPGILHLNRLVS